MRKTVGGVDLGKARAKLVVAELQEDGGLTVVSREVVAHEGRPLEAFAAWYERVRGHELTALAATGLHADEVLSPALTRLPESGCLEAALAARPEFAGPLNVLSVGARGYSVLTRDAAGRVQHLESDKCSSGTGETLVKMAARFGLDLDAADALAAGASSLIPITARCSVFAKSEMTHFANQGRPTDALFRGYIDSIARYVAALLARTRVPGPVLLVGGLARVATFRAQLAEHVGASVTVPEGAEALEAVGAAHLAAEQARARAPEALPKEARHLLRHKTRAFRELGAARGAAARVTRLSAAPPSEDARRVPTLLGLDLGSTGSKAVLCSVETGELLLDVYDRTRGNPVEAAQRLLATLLEQANPDVRALGVTGSGREAVASILRAAYPEAASRIVVMNEIVAHATAAIRCDERTGESLSVVEIGGQDAKFIQVAHGRIVESDMNKACSAGTGSFLEEQAMLYGVREIAEFTRLAASAERAPDLGQMCTVFVAEAAGEAQQAGFALPEVFAGFQYSVVHNYLNRVMGQRSFGERIFFQGKPASGESLAWTLAAVTGREVVVPANPGAMGAWGIALSARDALGSAALASAPAFALSDALDARIEQRSEFQCKDARCATLCNIERTTVAVGTTKKTVFSGGACPKFELATGARAKLPEDAPSAFDEREAALAPFLARSGGRRLVGVPEVGAAVGVLPWLVTFLSELELGVAVLRADATALSRGEERCHSYDSCAPMKLAHAVADADVELLFMPKLLELDDRDGEGGTTCASELAMADVVGRALRSRGRAPRIVSSELSLRKGTPPATRRAGLLAAARELGVTNTARVERAAARADAAQRGYETRLADIGRRTLAFGEARGLPIVAVCGSLHVLHAAALNAGIPKILQENGVLPLPMDCFPIPRSVPALERAVWADANRALRVALACRENGRAFPLLLSSFGCGPASFTEQVFDAVMQGYPRTALETDGHGGAAGYVTRIQSFLHGVRQYRGGASPLPLDRLQSLTNAEPRRLREDRDAELVMLPIGNRLGGIAAAAYRSIGYDAVVAPPASHEVLAAGRRDCSGKECLPYQLIWGAFRQHLAEAPKKRRVLMQVSGEGSCRNCMFSVKDKLSLEHLALDEEVSVRHIGTDTDARVGFFLRFWTAGVAWDVLNQLRCYHRPAEAVSGAADALYEEYCDRIEAAVERDSQGALRTLVEQERLLNDCKKLLREASPRFAATARAGAHREDFRTVFLAGDIYLRIDDFSNDGLTRRLGERGLRVFAEPMNVFIDYFVEERSAEIFGLPTGLVETTLLRTLLRHRRRALYRAAQQDNPWLPLPDAADSIRARARVMSKNPVGEAPVTIGSVLHTWQERACDGVVLISPWGCGHGLIAEAMLRHEREIPALYLYSDGSPLDERKLNAFAYQLKRQPARARSDAATRLGDRASS